MVALVATSEDQIPSPIEQNRHHVFLLQRAFDDGLIKAPKRLGLVRWKPDLRSLVLVSDNARIDQPRRKTDGVEQVIKADQLKTRLETEFDKTPDRSVLGLIGKQGLEAFARDLASLHRPATWDWAARFGLPTEPPAGGSPPLAEDTPRRGSGHKCASCSAPVSFAVVKFCWNNKQRFGDKIYCMDCQESVA